MALLAKYLWPYGQQFGGFVKTRVEQRRGGVTYPLISTRSAPVPSVYAPATPVSDSEYLTKPWINPAYTWPNDYPADMAPELELGAGYEGKYFEQDWDYNTLPWYDDTPFWERLLHRHHFNVAPYTEYKFRKNWWEDYAANTNYDPLTFDPETSTGVLRLSGFLSVDPGTAALYMASNWSDDGRPDHGTATSSYDAATGILTYEATETWAAMEILNTLSLITPETGNKDGVMVIKVLYMNPVPTADPGPLLPENFNYRLEQQTANDRSTATAGDYGVGHFRPSRAWPAVDHENAVHTVSLVYSEDGLAYWYKFVPDLYVGTGTAAGTISSSSAYRNNALYNLVRGSTRYAAYNRFTAGSKLAVGRFEKVGGASTYSWVPNSYTAASVAAGPTNSEVIAKYNIDVVGQQVRTIPAPSGTVDPWAYEADVGPTGFADATGQGLDAGFLTGMGDPAKNIGNVQQIIGHPEKRTKNYALGVEDGVYSATIDGATFGWKSPDAELWPPASTGNTDKYGASTFDSRKQLYGDWSFMNGNYSIRFDLKGAHWAGGNTHIMGKWSANGADLIWGIRWQSTGNLEIQCGPNASFRSSQPVNNVGTTHKNICLTKNGNKFTLFVDGVQVSIQNAVGGILNNGSFEPTVPVSNGFTTEALLVGCGPINPENGGTITLRDLRFYRMPKYTQNFTKPAFPDWK